MESNNSNSNLDKLLALSKEELEAIFRQLSLEEIDNLLTKLNEVVKDD